MERGETDVGHFLFAKNEALIGRGIVRLRNSGSGHRGCGCATHQRKTQSGGPQHLHGGGFGCALLLRSLLHSWHGRILRKFCCERFNLTWQVCLVLTSVPSCRPRGRALPLGLGQGARKLNPIIPRCRMTKVTDSDSEVTVWNYGDSALNSP